LSTHFTSLILDLTTARLLSVEAARGTSSGVNEEEIGRGELKENPVKGTFPKVKDARFFKSGRKGE